MYSKTRFGINELERDNKDSTFNLCNFSTKLCIFCCVVPEISSLFPLVTFSRFFLYFRQNSRDLQNLKNLTFTQFENEGELDSYIGTQNNKHLNITFLSQNWVSWKMKQTKRLGGFNSQNCLVVWQ